MHVTTHTPKAARPLFLGLAAGRSTHSRATNQLPQTGKGSRRFAFERCRPWALLCAGVGLVAAIIAALAAVSSLAVSDDIGALFFGSWSVLIGAGSAYLGLGCFLREAR